ncbi:MAG: CPBP family intramembrane metalloprotease [Chitinophagia bacterium]|nr:CPBP family intramembrane metalloprotease [Chitinophagia bacterium]
MNYLITYSKGIQLIMLISLLFIVAYLGQTAVSTLFPLFTGVPYHIISHPEMRSTPYIISLSVIASGIMNLSMFFIPSLLFAYLSHPKAAAYIGFKPPKNGIVLILAPLLLLVSIPVLGELQVLVSRMPFSPSVKNSEKEIQQSMGYLLQMQSPADLTRLVVVMAILPAVSEELFFRGLLLRMSVRLGGNAFVPIFFSSLVFAVAHSSLYSLPSILIAGMLLAFIYYNTGSLWCSMLAHACFNSVQILGEYYQKNLSFLNTLDNNQWLKIGFLLVTVATGAILMMLIEKSKSPFNPVLPLENSDNNTSQP